MFLSGKIHDAHSLNSIAQCCFHFSFVSQSERIILFLLMSSFVISNPVFSVFELKMLDSENFNVGNSQFSLSEE